PEVSCDTALHSKPPIKSNHDVAGMPRNFNATICLFLRDALLPAPSNVKEFRGNAQAMFWDAFGPGSSTCGSGLLPGVTVVAGRCGCVTPVRIRCAGPLESSSSNELRAGTHTACKLPRPDRPRWFAQLDLIFGAFAGAGNRLVTFALCSPFGH